jgi:hypothetical protein
MGSRSTQLMGLSEQALTLVAGEEVLLYTEQGQRVYPDGREEKFSNPVYESDVKKEHYGWFDGMFGEEYPLYEYQLADGSILREAIQATPWSAGPCIFLGLQDDESKWLSESLWEQAEIDNC